jgi:hypothetical protein
MLLSVILPENAIAMRVDRANSHSAFVIVMQVDWVMQKPRREKPQI